MKYDGRLYGKIAGKFVEVELECEIPDYEKLIRKHFHGFTDEQWEVKKLEFPYCEVAPIIEDFMSLFAGGQKKLKTKQMNQIKSTEPKPLLIPRVSDTVCDCSKHDVKVVNNEFVCANCGEYVLV